MSAKQGQNYDIYVVLGINITLAGPFCLCVCAPNFLHDAEMKSMHDGRKTDSKLEKWLSILFTLCTIREKNRAEIDFEAELMGAIKISRANKTRKFGNGCCGWLQRHSSCSCQARIVFDKKNLAFLNCRFSSSP